MASATPVCSVCDLRSITKPSIIWCFECEEGLCTECKDHHSLSNGTRKHCTVPISEYLKIPCDVVKITQICGKHNEKFNIYCKKHESLCCGICVVENHLACRDFGKLTDIIPNIKFSNAFYEMDQSLADLSENIQKLRNGRENNLKRLSKKKRQIEQAIKTTRIKINNHLDKIQDNIMKKLKATEEKESKLISELIELLNEKESEISVYRTNIRDIKQHATDLQKFIYIKELETKISIKDKFLQSVIDSENFKDCELSYNTNAAIQDLTNHIETFGEVKIEMKQCNVVFTGRKDKQAQIMVPHMSSISVENIHLKLHKSITCMRNREHYTKGCCMLPNGRIVFTDTDNKLVEIFNMDGTKYFEVKIPSCPYDIAYISENNTLAVTSGGSIRSCITIIDINKQKIKSKIPVNINYYGIAVGDGIFVCSAMELGIHLINWNNKSTSEIVRDEYNAAGYVAKFGDKIYQTSGHSNSVICYDINGTEKWSFKDEDVLSQGNITT